MTVVAEGVETFEELAYLLAATNIRVVQGFYFCPPFPQKEAHNVARRFKERDRKALGDSGSMSDVLSLAAAGTRK